MGRLRVASYNLSGAVGAARRFYGRLLGGGGRIDRARDGARAAARLLAREGVDIVALQEADDAGRGDIRVHQPELIATALGHRALYQPLVDLDLAGWVSARSGLALTSSLPVGRVDSLDLPERRRPRLFRRRAQVVDYRVDGLDITVINVHLCHDDSEIRARQLQVVLEHAREHAPAVIVGDLNTTPPASRGPGMLEAELYRSDSCVDALGQCEGLSADARTLAMLHGGELGGLATYPSDHPVLKLDYVVVVDSGGRLRVHSERVLPTSPELSDHRPVIATLEWSSP